MSLDYFMLDGRRFHYPFQSFDQSSLLRTIVTSHKACIAVEKVVNLLPKVSFLQYSKDLISSCTVHFLKDRRNNEVFAETAVTSTLYRERRKT